MTKFVLAWATVEDMRPSRRKATENIIPEIPCRNIWCQEPCTAPNNKETNIITDQRIYLFLVIKPVILMGANRKSNSSAGGLRTTINKNRYKGRCRSSSSTTSDTGDTPKFSKIRKTVASKNRTPRLMTPNSRPVLNFCLRLISIFSSNACPHISQWAVQIMSNI